MYFGCPFYDREKSFALG